MYVHGSTTPPPPHKHTPLDLQSINCELHEMSELNVLNDEPSSFFEYENE